MRFSLDSIGFYTLTDERARMASAMSPIARLELLLGARCNFACTYCRGVGGPDITLETAWDTVRSCSERGIVNIRFSGGEPTLHKWLPELASRCAGIGIKRIAVSSNGSAPITTYRRLVDAGVNDFSISLDACCASDGDAISGVDGSWNTVTMNLPDIASMCYTTVGIVLTKETESTIANTIRLAHAAGVSDIRIIPAAQYDNTLRLPPIEPEILERYPILRYRYNRISCGLPLRGCPTTPKCALVLDDIAIMSNQHYPCIIYMREGGEPIGKIGPDIRQQRAAWSESVDTTKDTTCRNNCLDVCIAYNSAWEEVRGD